MEKTCNCLHFNYRLLADAVEDAIVVCEHDRICLANSYAVTLCGWSEDELLGMGIEFLLPDYRPRPEGPTQLNARRKDGSDWLATVSIRNIPDASRKLTMLSIRDLTNIECSNKNQTDLLVQLTRTMAADLIDLLSAMLLNGQAGLKWLSSDIPNLPRASQTFEALVRNSKEAAELVSQLRALIALPQITQDSSKQRMPINRSATPRPPALI
jgi:PAS domain S-box-containing protein